eukprot:Clim_evm19s205 gene=Clim_evmTU19s205
MAGAARSVGKLVPETTAFFLCDVQEKFRGLIRHCPEIIEVSKRMCTAAGIMNIPLIVTEQYPEKLGKTVAEIDTSKATAVVPKTLFSMCTEDVTTKLKEVRPNVKSVVLFGIEAHVCVLQTCLDLVEAGMDVHVVADATSSRTDGDRFTAFERMRQAGVFVTTSESALFMLMKDKNFTNFREVSGLIKQSVDTGLANGKL